VPAVDLIDALRTTGAVREFRPDPVPDAVLARVLDTARFAPSGGNRQGWRVVVLRDPDLRAAVRDLYLEGWYDYLALGAAGLTPWSPTSDRDAEAAALTKAPEVAAAARAGAGGFAEHLDRVPALLVLLADLGALATVDRDLDRYTFAGGASIYPFAWSVLLAAHAEGLGGVVTTMSIRTEDRLAPLLHVPDDHAVAGVIALGYPARRATRLRRQPIDAFATVDTCDGEPFPAPPP
jgi:nitroreductase